MKTIISLFSIATYLRASLLIFAMLYAPFALALVSDVNEQQQADYEVIANTLSELNGSIHTAEGIFANTYWVDAENGVNDYDRSGQIDQPWQSITWAMNNIPFAKDTANVVVRAGVYSPSVLYIGEERGGSLEADSPFNLLAFPGDEVKLDGTNVADNGALISISGANHVSLSGFEISNITGSGKSAIYITGSEKITITNNEIHHSQWTSDAQAATSPSLSDRLNGIAVVGDSQDITINNNEIHDLITGYGEPILVLAPAVATVADNSVHDNDADIFENQQYYVSQDGNDSTGIGTADQPWKTIHKALFSIPFAEDNATINIREGRYQIDTAMYFDASRGGSEGKYFTVQAYNGEEVIVDGGLLKTPFSAMVSFSSTAYVRIKGLTFTNLSGPKSGIYMEGNSHHIELIDNKLHGMTWVDEAGEDPLAPAPSDNLNPIAVIGNNPEEPIHSVVIRGNELFDIIPGYSEAIKIVGNVTDFLVEENHIHDVANIGIVAAGNYQWVKDSNGVLIPAEVNHARDGIIRNNTVSNAISPVANSAGIYLDGAHNVLVEGNISHHNSVGFSVGCEQPGTTDGNILRGNIAYENVDAGLVVGTIHAGATVTDTTVELNEFKYNYTKGGWGGELTIQQVDGLFVHNNIFVSNSDLKLIATQPASNLSIDNNLYFGQSADPDAAVFDWGGIAGKSYVGLSEFQTKSCYDLNSLYQDAATINYFEELANRSANMTDGDLEAHNYRTHRGHKRDHHGRNGRNHPHGHGGAENAVCESGQLVTPEGDEIEETHKGKKRGHKKKGKGRQPGHEHTHSHEHVHHLKHKGHKHKGEPRFIRHSHPHTHTHKHKGAHE
ncbi:right-handed parallel beta-helix repeat-containing protein [Leucothrix pacifica]|uniref:Right handed beta helix domain-containing protein n=1 Tax=Leucothrix pacifica TaxID=1247513 RepID=A0A317CLM4_9GAMM|nr:right-handed parallel beta-helix repeat-containing protein [Leucothrix pacifica]PWQ99494.1 hypothetical protein DKW60_05635 [Leucothrix pacifica]